MVYLPVPQGDPPQHPEDLDTRLSQSRIIAAALIFGQVLFVAITGFLLHNGMLGSGGSPDGFEWVSHIGAGLALLAIPLAFGLRHVHWSRARAERDARHGARIQTGTIIFLVILEGATLFNIVCWMLSGAPVPHVPLIAILLAAQLCGFPLRSHFAPRESY